MAAVVARRFLMECEAERLRALAEQVLVDNGRKARLIVSELDRRGHGLVDRISCRACAGHLWKG